MFSAIASYPGVTSPRLWLARGESLQEVEMHSWLWNCITFLPEKVEYCGRITREYDGDLKAFSDGSLVNSAVISVIYSCSLIHLAACVCVHSCTPLFIYPLPFHSSTDLQTAPSIFLSFTAHPPWFHPFSRHPFIPHSPAWIPLFCSFHSVFLSLYCFFHSPFSTLLPFFCFLLFAQCLSFIFLFSTLIS